MRRSPMNRATQKAIAWARAPRKRIKPRSDKRARFMREVYVPAVRAVVGKPCGVRSRVCTGTAEGLHEPLTRARAGGLEVAFAAGAVASCHPCNEFVSQTVEGQRWATARGLLRRASEKGPCILDIP